MTISEQRAAVISEARSWIGTPFHNNAHIKGAGIDCAWLVAESYNVGVGTSIVVREYPPQWGFHRNEEWYIDDLLAAGFVEIEEASKQTADIVLVKRGRVYWHGALISNWPMVIHAPSKGDDVREANALVDDDIAGRPVKYFSWGAWHADA